MSEEIIIYEQNNIKITNLRAVFSEKTFSISNITSVEMLTIHPSSSAVGLLALLGLAMLACGILNVQENYIFLIIGAILFGAVFYINRSLRPTYAVNLTTASGEVKAYISEDQPTIQKIVEALNTAIIQKG